LHPRLREIEMVMEFLLEAASMAAVAARKQYRHRHRKRGGQVLKPGPDTPLWNVLAATCESRLVRYGDKARLGRMLGVSRQQIHRLIVAKTACPDGERTLNLLVWLGSQIARVERGSTG